MKKEITIILVILIFIIVLNCITQNYTKQSVQLLINKLEEVKQESLNQEDKNEILQKKTDEIYKLWKQKESKLAYYIEHDELEKVEAKISLIKGNIQTNSYEEIVSDIEEAIFILNHIEEKYKFIIKNVF